jgi:Potential Queuosine, Q, salvage protein family
VEGNLATIQKHSVNVKPTRGNKLSDQLQITMMGDTPSDGPPTIPDDNKVGNEDEDECPCANVRRTCASWLVSHPNDVTIDASAVPKLCDDIVERQRHASLEWDSEGWHYRPPLDWPLKVRQERIALYILALDAINFCFWPHEGYEYDDLATTLTSIASIDQHHDRVNDNDDDGAPSLESYALSASNLSHMSVEDMTALFMRHHPNSLCPPDMDQRCRLWNEVGAGLLAADCGGSATQFIEQARGSAPDLVRLLLFHFPGFRDCSSEVWFLKRAQICVGDLNAALRLNLKGMDHLTTFPDYRVPQLLREYGVLKYSKALSNTVDHLVELVAGSSEECSIRAATVLAVDCVVQELNNNARKEQDPLQGSTNPTKEKWTAVEADWVLWQIGEGRIQSMRPHHRVRTTFY